LLAEDEQRTEMLIQMLKNQDFQNEAERKRKDEEYALKLQREYEQEEEKQRHGGP
jgi:hypothetical protein